MKTNYYLGGYYLILQKPIRYGGEESKIINSASNCFNKHLLGGWSYMGSSYNYSRIDEIKQECFIDDATIAAIKEWTSQASDENKIGWLNVFNDLETLHEYKNTFFSHLNDVKILGIYFEDSVLETGCSPLIPKYEFEGSGIYQNVSKRIPEVSQLNQILLGFDIIGIEAGKFHTFYCHSMAANLVRRFDLELNEYGLFNDSDRWEQVAEYFNGDSGAEPVPWVICKVKLVDQ